MESDDPDADTASILPQLILIVVLTAVNAFFAAAEMAVVSANKNKIRRLAADGNKKARNVEKLVSDETKFLSTIQVGITLAGFFSSATASVTLSEGFGKWLLGIGIPYGDKISMILITVILSYITLIFGELLPKRIALRDPESISMSFAGVLLVVKFFASPFVRLLSGSCNLLAKLFGLDKNMDEGKISDEDIVDVVTEGVSDGSIEEDKQKIIESTLNFYHLNGASLMTPRVDVFMIDIDDPAGESIDKMLSEQFTRVPVYKDSIDNVLGIINVKDVLIYARHNGFESVDLGSLIRPAFSASEYTDASELLNQMKQGNHQMALLFDEFGGFSGIVTMEDLVEEIVGSINDEYDTEEDTEAEIVEMDENTYLINGSVTINEINTELDTKLEDDSPDYDTVAGLVMYLSGEIPSQGDAFEDEDTGIILKVEEIIDLRITKVLMTIPEDEDDEDKDEDDD